MSTTFCTPQRIVTGHTSRFVRRSWTTAAGVAPTLVDIHPWFNPRLLTAGERDTVFAQFAAGVVWNAASATFTLLAAGTPIAGYNAVAATLVPDPSGRLFTASATIDLTPEATYPLAGGIYYGEFLITTSTGEIVAARGPITIITPGAGSPPDEYETEAGLG